MELQFARHLAISVLICAVAAVGCGGGSADSDQKDAGSSAADSTAAQADGGGEKLSLCANVEKACDIEPSNTNCEQTLKGAESFGCGSEYRDLLKCMVRRCNAEDGEVSCDEQNAAHSKCKSPEEGE